MFSGGNDELSLFRLNVACIMLSFVFTMVVYTAPSRIYDELWQLIPDTFYQKNSGVVADFRMK